MTPTQAFEGESLGLRLRRRSKSARIVSMWAVGSESDHIAGIGRHLFQTLDHLVDRLNQPPRRRAAALRQDKPCS